MKKPRLVIAGGTGSNGRELFIQLSANRAPTHALVRDLARYADLASANVVSSRFDAIDHSAINYDS